MELPEPSSWGRQAEQGRGTPPSPFSHPSHPPSDDPSWKPEGGKACGEQLPRAQSQAEKWGQVEKRQNPHSPLPRNLEKFRGEEEASG